jgi:hypothetical protein
LDILGFTNVCFDVYECPCSICIQGLLLTLNGLHIMVTLGIYFEYIKVYIRYLVNALQPYYKFVQSILLYFLKLLQMTSIVIFLLSYLFLLITL